MAGAVFAGNYFGGEVHELAQQIYSSTQFSEIVTLDINNPSVFTHVLDGSFQFTFPSHSFSEYLLPAYIATLQDPSRNSAWFDKFYGENAAPTSSDTNPHRPNYWGHVTLSPNSGAWLSSFVPQMGRFLTKFMHNKECF